MDPTSDLRLRILVQFREMPGLRLTEGQAARLSGLDESSCAVLLRSLEREGVLRRTSAGYYVVPGES